VTELEPPYREILELFHDGQIVPVLGAGASLSERGSLTWDDETSACLPTAGELGRYLAGRVNFPAGESTSDLAKVAQYFRVVVGRSVLRRRLHEIFTRDVQPVSVHGLLAEARRPLLIVTTNYDDLIERAFQERGRPYDLVVHPTDNDEWAAAVLHWPHGATQPTVTSPKKLVIDLAQTTVIYKMHGTIDRRDTERDAYVITEDDYADFLVRMANRTAIPAIFSQHFQRRHFLFLGYSLNDWNFRVILSKLERDLPRNDREETFAWSIQNNPSALEQELWNRRRVTIYDMPIKEFVAGLRASRT
jgi:hypothetical protein